MSVITDVVYEWGELLVITKDNEACGALARAVQLAFAPNDNGREESVVSFWPIIYRLL